MDPSVTTTRLAGKMHVLMALALAGGFVLSSSAKVVPPLSVMLASGPIDDAKCNSEDIIKANSLQLGEILEELTDRTFFRLFPHTEGAKCTFWESTDTAHEEEHGGVGTEEKADEECDGGMVESLFAKKKEPACTVHVEKAPAGNPFLGGGMGGGGGMSLPEAPSPGGGLGSEKVDEALDRTLSSPEEVSLVHTDDCTRPEFWLDMCDQIPANTSDFINLQLNPERWTGYNGSHVWDAIYRENCFQTFGGFDDMCYEERVLYRLLSGMHASVNIHISMNFFPPSKGSKVWRPNSERFIRQYGAHPEFLKNLYFSYAVMLRALNKAGPFLSVFPFETGDSKEDARTMALMRRMLDSQILSSCETAFTAFDDELMFSDGTSPSSLATLKREFKGVFQNITRVLDCVTCQKCRLHGKLQLLGLGTALRILILPTSLLPTAFTRPELVAFMQSLHKFSSAVTAVDELLRLHWLKLKDNQDAAQLQADDARKKKDAVEELAKTARGVAAAQEDASTFNGATLGVLVAAVAAAGRGGLLNESEEDTLVDLALAGNSALSVLAQHYSGDGLIKHARRNLGSLPNWGASDVPQVATQPDAVVVGGGLAGLTAALTVLDRGGRVVIIEKEASLGGNSAYASSGINGVDDGADREALAAYKADILAAGRGNANEDLVDTLVNGSADAVKWLRERVGVALPLKGQLGGHTWPRTHRPAEGLAGSEIIVALQKQLKSFDTSRLEVRKNTKAKGLVVEDGKVVGIEAETTKPPLRTAVIRAGSVVLATGGYASQPEPGGLIEEHRPDLMSLGSTNGAFATGDGHTMAGLAGAALTDMGDVQVHPTGFVDPKNPSAKVKTLCAEILRGVGGVLLNASGHRFCNELGTRDYVTASIKAQVHEDGAVAQAFLVLNEDAATEANKHLSMYTRKGLLQKFDNLSNLAAWMVVDEESVQSTLSAYDTTASTGGKDPYGRVVFNNPGYLVKGGPFYAGIITPVLHYCMGGLAIGPDGTVLTEENTSIPGLYAVGEIAGGIHGTTRLGGNALTECVVFGRSAGLSMPLASKASEPTTIVGEPDSTAGSAEGRIITAEELAKHATPADCWVAIHGLGYDLTEFADEHPGGVESILELCGKDGSEEFAAVHAPSMMDVFDSIGKFSSGG